MRWLVTSLVVLILFALVAPLSLAALPRPVWFSYLDNTSIVDEMNGYDGTNSGCDTVSRAGQTAIFCDEADYFTFPKNAQTNVSEYLSACWWGMINISLDPDASHQRVWGYYGSLGPWVGVSWDRRGTGGGSGFYEYSSQQFDEVWRHFCVTFSQVITTISAEKVTIYENGALDDETAGGAGTISYNSAQAYVLGGVNTTHPVYPAYIDNFALFDHVLSAGDISSLYSNLGVPDLTTGVGVGTCGGNYSYSFLNFTIYDEDNTTNTLTTSVDIDGNITIGSTTFNITQALAGEDSYLLCSTNNTGTAALQAYIKYYGNDVTTRYYVINDSLSLGTENVYSLYRINDTDDSSVLKLTVRRVSNYNYYPNIITKLQRYYVGESVYKTVQMDKTDDYGLVTFNVYERTTDYRLLFLTEANELLATTTNLKFVCVDSLCELTYLINDLTTPDDFTDFTINSTYNATTGIITINWSDPLGGTHTVDNAFTRHTITGTMRICNSTQIGSTGGVTCNVSGYNGAVLVTAYTTTQNLIHRWVDLDSTALYDVLDADDAAVLTLIIFVTTIGLGAASPVATLIAGTLGLVIIRFMGIFTPITVGAIILAIVGGLAIAFGVKKNR